MYIYVLPPVYSGSTVSKGIFRGRWAVAVGMVEVEGSGRKLSSVNLPLRIEWSTQISSGVSPSMVSQRSEGK